MNEVVDEPSGGSDERIAWPEILALAMVLVTFAVAIHETRGLSWSPRQDIHCEMGATQSILEGRPSLRVRAAAAAEFRGHLFALALDT